MWGCIFFFLTEWLFYIGIVIKCNLHFSWKHKNTIQSTAFSIRLPWIMCVDVLFVLKRFSMEGLSSILQTGIRQTFGSTTIEKQVKIDTMGFCSALLLNFPFDNLFNCNIYLDVSSLVMQSSSIVFSNDFVVLMCLMLLQSILLVCWTLAANGLLSYGSKNSTAGRR